MPLESTMTPSVRQLKFREFAPPASLAGTVECIWLRQRWRPQETTLGVLPDGRVDLVWATNGQIVVMGPQTRAANRPLPSRAAAIGVRFCPGAGPPILGIPALELVDRQVPLEAIDTHPASRLRKAVANFEAVAAAPAAVESVLRRLMTASTLDRVVLGAARLLHDPTARVDQVATELAISERQLQRRFRATIGYGPKTLQRVLRFRRMLAALACGRDAVGGMARIAYESGYCDQAHLARECQLLSSLGPARLATALVHLQAQGAMGAFKTTAWSSPRRLGDPSPRPMAGAPGGNDGMRAGEWTVASTTRRA
jgi:AraC-like DNA-binding protein